MAEDTKDRLLLYCLGIGASDARVDRLMNLSTDDWNEVIRQAIRHGVCPLLYHQLNTLEADLRIPTDIEQRLQEIYFHSMKRNMQLFCELSKVLSLFQKHHIPVIVLKGARLAELVYEDTALRPMSDIDLLIKVEDRFLIDRLMLRSGYRNLSLFSKRHWQWENAIHCITYSSEIVNIECHTSIHGLSTLNPWADASSTTIASTDVLMLCTEKLLLHLCVHIYKHLHTGLPKLIWWYDIAEVLKRYQVELDWDYVIQLSREHEVEGVVHRVLYLISREFGVYVPIDVLNQFEDDGDIISIDHVLHNVKKLKGRFIPSTWLSDISGIPLVRDKIYYIFARLFPCKEYMIACYSLARPNLVYLHYPIRIFLFILSAIRWGLRLPARLWNRYASSKG